MSCSRRAIVMSCRTVFLCTCAGGVGSKVTLIVGRTGKCLKNTHGRPEDVSVVVISVSSGVVLLSHDIFHMLCIDIAQQGN